MESRKNVVLIGMPGAGKSTLGVILAKALSMPFLDTDIHIQTREEKSLQSIIRASGRGTVVLGARASWSSLPAVPVFSKRTSPGASTTSRSGTTATSCPWSTVARRGCTGS